MALSMKPKFMENVAYAKRKLKLMNPCWIFKIWSSATDSARSNKPFAEIKVRIVIYTSGAPLGTGLTEPVDYGRGVFEPVNFRRTENQKR